MLAIAAELAGFEGIVVVICPLKSLQKDQVGCIELSNKKNTRMNRTIGFLGEEVQQHAHNFVVGPQ